MRVLIVEDEIDLATSLAEGLRADGYTVDVAHDGATALSRIQLGDPDVIVLDRNLPILDGDTVCRTLSAMRHPVRILMLTAAAGLDDRVEGLDLGADDYLTKPFAYRELTARINALTRRLDPGDTSRSVADLILDTAGQKVTRRGMPVRLSTKEYAVLEALVVANGGLVTYRQLIDHAWDEDYDTERAAVKMAVYSLRRKLGTPDLIVAEHGRGYRIEAPS
ncbi:response regulator transcription factor [Micromonospora peucetia]|uniref:response regulator transcription factor n=1 Tax=Micromonospora peucetia TaxID=47871 RepID=UPI0033300C62